MEAESPPGGQSPKENITPIENGYKEFVKGKVREYLGKPELTGVRNWIEQRFASLPEMEVTESPMTDGDKWKHDMTQDGQLQKVTSGFLNMEGRRVAIKNPDGTIKFEWVQGMIKENEVPVTFPTPDGPITMNTSGLVGIIRDDEGNVLLSVKQEPLAQTEKQGIVNTPLQTSSEKAKKIMEEGKPEYDQNFSKTVALLGGGKSLSEMFASGEFELMPAPPANANRIEATNVGFVATVKDSEIKEKLVEDGTNRWCTPEEAKAIARSGLMNGFTASSLYATEPAQTQAA